MSNDDRNALIATGYCLLVLGLFFLFAYIADGGRF